MNKDEYRTPDFIFKQLDDIYCFTLDVACNDKNSLIPHCFSIDHCDSLKESWNYNRVFCNPPFSRKDEFVLKAHHEVQNNNCPIVVMILPLNSLSSPVIFDTCKQYEIEILRQRISFLDENNKPINGNNTGTAIVYFRKPITTRV